MKVILTMDVPEVGSRGDRLDVAAGFARNYLIPRRFAVPESAGNLRILAEDIQRSGSRERKARREADKIGSFLAEHDVFATLKIGREGKAFGAVTSKDLATLLRQVGLEVDRRRIRLESPIRRLGVFEVRLHIHADVSTLIKVHVDQEGGSREGAVAAQAVWQEQEDAKAEAARLEAEARAEREREAEEATRMAIERADARRQREEEAAKAREEAQKAATAAEVAAVAAAAQSESAGSEATGSEATGSGDPKLEEAEAGDAEAAEKAD